MSRSNRNQINLDFAMRELYSISNSYIYKSYFLQAILFLFNICLIFNKPSDNPNSTWILFAFSVVAIIVNLYFVNKSKENYKLGESLRKYNIIERNFPKISNSTQKSYLISTLPESIIEKAKRNPSYQIQYYTDKQNQYEKLIENIQENCYFTSEIMRTYASYLYKVMICVIIVLICLIIYSFIILSNNSTPTNIKLSKNIVNYLSLFINLIFTLNIIEHYNIFNDKYKELQKLDRELNSIKSNPNEEEIITFFTDYNCLLQDALPCPSFVYSNIKNKLNSVWENRVNND